MMVTLGITGLLAAGMAFATSSPDWRGPDRTGQFPASDLMQSWPANGPPRAWSIAIGHGYSSVSVAGDTIYTAGIEEGQTGYLYAIDLKGNLRWKRSYGPEWTRSYSGTRSTPVVSDGRIFLVSGIGRAVAIDAANGRELWNIDLLGRFGGRNIQWGISESPLVYDGKVVFTPGGTRASIVALDVRNGEQVWATPPVAGPGGPMVSAYCSPALIEHNGRRLIVTHLSHALVAVDASDGRLLWSIPYRNRHGVHTTTPLYYDGLVITSSGYGYGSMAVRLSEDGSSATVAWRNDDLAVQLGGLVEVDGRIYGMDSSLVVLDAASGRKVGEAADITKGAIARADGLLYWFAERGEFGIAQITESGARIVGRVTLPRDRERLWAHPTIAEGLLFVRRGSDLIAYDIRADQ
ncbi:MAG: PQQ-like beta-propeller repeat protein [Phycisphaeraceae bacterium]|nr:PQQ-like beta-propeller repeat protein [Phycisphaeraceae bacterium]